jgi:nucleoid-associated protein YgaU
MSLGALRNKYRSVFEVAQAQGVQLSAMRDENGKLVLRGTAPSQDAVNKVREEIKRVNPALDDISAEFSVMPSAAPAVPQTRSEGIENQSSETIKHPTLESGAHNYTVKPGDTLTSISKHFYGSATEYRRILDANRDKIEHPNLLEIGQELTIP